MNFKQLVLSTCIIATATFSHSQLNDKYEKIYYQNTEIEETDLIDVELKNIVSQKDHCKLSLKVNNNTSDFLLVQAKKASFKYPSFEKNPTVKEFFIKPNKTKSKTLMVNGSDQFLQETFSIDVADIFHIPEGEVVEAEDFQLPASKNSLELDNFKVKLSKYSASTKEAKATFEVTYTGEKVAIVNSANLSVSAQRKKSDEMVTYANDNKKSEPKILRKGEKTKLVAVFHIPGKIVDMQFATMQIHWNDTFSESELVQLPKISFDIKMNEGLTEEKK